MTVEMQDLVERGVYRLRGRNLAVAVWTGRWFIGIRWKFDRARLDEEYTYDDVRHAPFNTALPVERIGTLPEYLTDLRRTLGSVDTESGREVAYDRPVEAGGRGWYFVETGESSDEIRAQAVMNRRLYDFLRGVDFMERGGWDGG